VAHALHRVALGGHAVAAVHAALVDLAPGAIRAAAVGVGLVSVLLPVEAARTAAASGRSPAAPEPASTRAPGARRRARPGPGALPRARPRRRRGWARGGAGGRAEGPPPAARPRRGRPPAGAHARPPPGRPRVGGAAGNPPRTAPPLLRARAIRKLGGARDPRR